MIDFDEHIKAYRAEKDKKFKSYIEEIEKQQDFKRISIETSDGVIAVDIYRGKQAEEKAPVYFNFHGGGFVLGYHQLDGPYCRILADKAKCVVINVDYLLAPEYKFPKPIYSSFEAIFWCLENGDTLGIDIERIVIGGHSAGGNIAVGLTWLFVQKALTELKGCIVDYAPCDQRIENKDVLNQREMVECNRSLQYLSWYFTTAEELSDPLASPCLQTLTGFPKTLLISAEYDPLCKGEERFKTMLSRQHIPVEYHCFLNCGHGFTHRYYEEYQEQKAKEAWEIMGAFLHKCFYGHP